jgi:hypothetical protein
MPPLQFQEILQKNRRSDVAAISSNQKNIASPEFFLWFFMKYKGNHANIHSLELHCALLSAFDFSCPQQARAAASNQLPTSSSSALAKQA